MQRLFAAALVSVLFLHCPAKAEDAKAVGADAKLETTSDANFAHDVLNSKEPVFVDFFTTWCVPCKGMEPIVHKLADDYKGKLKVFSIDAEKNPIAAGKYSVEMYPTFCIFVNGKMALKQTGAKTAEALKQMLVTSHAI